MPRKSALMLLVLPLVLAATAAPAPPLSPRIAVAPCDEGAGRGAIAPVQALLRDRPETRAVLVLIDGCPAVRAYGAGYSEANRFISWSMAKTVTAMLIGALVTDGRLALDAPAPLAEWRRPGDPRGAITLRHLLQMRSGLAHVEVGDPVENSDTNQVLFVGGTRDMAARAIAQPLESAPGTRFVYSSLTTIILSEIVTRTLTNSRDPHTRAAAYRDFATTRLFAPAGIRSAFLEFDGAGTQIGGSLIHMTLDDWGRMGMLLLDGRNAAGRQVVDPRWLAMMKTPSPTNPEYGLQTWLNRPGAPAGEAVLFPDRGPADLASMNGHLGQFVMASPATGGGRGMVMVRLGHTGDQRLPAVIATMGTAFARVAQR